MRDHDQQLDQLANDITAAGLSKPEVQGIVYQLSPRTAAAFPAPGSRSGIDYRGPG